MDARLTNTEIVLYLAYKYNNSIAKKCRHHKKVVMPVI